MGTIHHGESGVFSNRPRPDHDAPYELFAPKVNEDWNWNRGESHGNNFASTSADLSKAMRRNPHMSVFFASGYYDLGTPYSATDWTIAQLDVPYQLLKRVTHCYYTTPDI